MKYEIFLWYDILLMQSIQFLTFYKNFCYGYTCHFTLLQHIRTLKTKIFENAADSILGYIYTSIFLF